MKISLSRVIAIVGLLSLTLAGTSAHAQAKINGVGYVYSGPNAGKYFSNTDGNKRRITATPTANGTVWRQTTRSDNGKGGIVSQSSAFTPYGSTRVPPLGAK